eukprot:Skav232695  [mRNA]  locus=scaffold860:48554:49559:- [translate_table: standard]
MRSNPLPTSHRRGGELQAVRFHPGAKGQHLMPSTLGAAPLAEGAKVAETAKDGRVELQIIQSLGAEVRAVATVRSDQCQVDRHEDRSGLEWDLVSRVGCLLHA